MKSIYFVNTLLKTYIDFIVSFATPKSFKLCTCLGNGEVTCAAKDKFSLYRNRVILEAEAEAEAVRVIINCNNMGDKLLLNFGKNF